MPTNSHSMTPMRIQICLGYTLQAEVIVHNFDVSRTWGRFTVAKWKHGKPFGGAVIRRADLPRIWKVKVGEKIHE